MTVGIVGLGLIGGSMAIDLKKGHIVKSPVRRIHTVKTGTQVKEALSDENID